MFFRANLDAMDRWATHGAPPPASRIPLRAEGKLVCIDEWRRQFPAIPGVATPTSPNVLPLLDFGPDAERGILREPPQPVPAGNAPDAPARQDTVLVPSVDADGNDVPGVRAPMVAAPLGTYTGWNYARAATATARSCASKAATFRSRRRRKSGRSPAIPGARS